MSLEAEISAELAALASANRLRRRPVGPRGIDFCSNDYLGLTRHPQLIEAGQQSLRASGAGGGAARLLGGGGAEQADAEQAAAAWLGAEDALLFPSGFQANLGLLGALADRRDGLVCDALLHASLIDAARLCRARVEVVPHGDLAAVDVALQRLSGARRRFVLTEGIFSMDGDRADLGGLNRLAEQHDAWLLVDEAHSVGLLGPAGRGAWAEPSPGENQRLLARLVTGGKALGVGGALVVGQRSLVELLVNRARSFIFTTAPPPAVAAMLSAAIGLMPSLEAARQTCLQLAQRLWEHLRALSLELGQPAPPAPAAAIVPWVLGSEAAALAAAEAAQAAGFDVRAVRPPTVPAGGSRLRLVTHAHNTSAQVDALAEVLAQATRSLGRRGDLPANDQASVATQVVKERGTGDAQQIAQTGQRPALVSTASAPSTSTDLNGGSAQRVPAPGTQHAAPTAVQARPPKLASGQSIAQPTTAHWPAKAQKRPLFVIGTDTGIGKTVSSALALLVLQRRGPVGYWKPVQTGSDSDTGTVRGLVEGRGDVLLAEPLRHYALPASPDQAAAAEGQAVPTEALTQHLEALQAQDPERLWVVELAGGLLVPYLDDWSQADWLQSWRGNSELLLVARAGLGTLNHTQLTLEALRRRGLEPSALLLVGPEHRPNRDYLSRTSGVRQILQLPHLEPLSASSLAEVARSIDPERLCP
jgi:8-amino-7-oxononanoate synthase